MQTIIVLLNPGMIENADLDLRYRIPDRIEEVSNSLIQSNGYDYIDTEDGEPGPLMGMILSILVYTFFSRMFDLMLPPVAKHSIVVA